MAVTKIINSETKNYKPLLTDKLVLDDAPKSGSFNAITSDAVARAIAGASGEVPQVTESDNGKVLKAIYDAGGPAVEWGEATVDQTYDATSTNAQSGVAVAQALAEIPAPEEEVSVLSYGVANTEVTFLKSPNVKMVIASPEVNQTGLTALTYDSGVGTSINQNTTFLMFKLDGKPQYLTGNSGGELVISEDLAFPVTSQGAWGNMFVFPVIPSNPRYGDMAINIQGSPIVGGVIKAGTYTLVTSTAHPPISSDYSDLAVLIQVGGSSQSVIDTAQQFLIDNASKFSIKWRGETYRATFPSADKLVPASTSTDAGKILTVNAQGAAAWATPSGGGGSSTSAFDTTFNLVNDGSVWRLSKSSSDYINLTGGAGVYAYRVDAEIYDSSNPTEIDDIYNITVRVGNSNTSSETKAIGLRSDISDPDVPATILFRSGGILNVVTNDQHVRGQNVYVLIQPAKTSGTAVSSFTGGSVTLYLAKLSTLSGGWQPES